MALRTVMIAMAVLGLLAAAAPAQAQTQAQAQAQAPLNIVAAESFYGDVAGQVAGPGVPVTSILSSPDQDPHQFEVNPSAARAVAAARIVVYNGAGYDPWMAKLVQAQRAPGRQVLVAADLVNRKAGDNPHLWYDPAVMPAVARALANALAAADPANAGAYAERQRAFEESLRPIAARIADLRARFADVPVAATEPVFGYMAAAVGLVTRNERFQLAIMNGTEPRASDVAAFEADLKNKRVRALIYNSQATGPAARRLLRLAGQAGVPVVGVTETQPAGTTYQSWMMTQLDALEAALSAPR